MPALSKPKHQTKPLTMKQQLDAWVAQHKTPSFIATDPLSLPDRYRHDLRNCELVALITALLSYGRRDLILQTVENVLDRMDGDPRRFVEHFSACKGSRAFKGFVYRFNRGEDLTFLCARLQHSYATHGSLEGLWLAANKLEQTEINGTRGKTARFMDAFLADTPELVRNRYGLKFLLPHPNRGGACKRLNMFLRWMVRNDDIDLGLWKTALTPADLVMPLDTHVASVGRKLGLITRNVNDWHTAEALTEVFRGFSPTDPVKYDFALFGAGVAGSTKLKKKPAVAR